MPPSVPLVLMPLKAPLVLMPLKAPLVLTVAGLKSKWKQAILFSYVKDNMPPDELLCLLRRTLDEVAEAGLHVTIFSTGQGSNLASLLMFIRVSRTNPSFQYDGQIIAVTADRPHARKSTKNCLLNYRIETSDGTARWNDIVALFEEEKKANFCLCLKLRSAHFHLKSF